jgi:signal recognition particle subunit SRP54
MLPGVPNDLKQASSMVDDRQIGQVEAIIRSMTPAERVDPSSIDGSRRVRIANGSGTATADVNALLKQFKEMQKMMKGLGKGKGGMAGGLGALFGRGPKGPMPSPDVLAQMAELSGGPELAGLGAGPGGDASAPGRNGGQGRPSGSKGKGGKKGKGGGRVTPKAR